MTRQAGFTLLELLIGLAIAGLIAGFLGTFVYETMRVTNSGNDHLLVTDDLRSAAAWLSQDGQMADFATSMAATSSLVLSWTDAYSGANIGYRATYSVAGTELQRSYGVRGGTQVTTTVARHIASAQDVRFALGNGMLTATITSTAGTVSEGQQIQVGLRSR